MASSFTVGSYVPGPRVLAEIELFPADEGGLGFELQERNRSLLFVFPALEDDPVQQGAMVEKIFGARCASSRVVAQIQFFDDSAAIVATPGAKFNLWLGRTVGRGVIKEVVSDR